MKNTFILAFFVFDIFILKADSWTQKANYAGGYISNAVAFTLGTKGYVGLGVDSLSAYHSDFWEYDPATNTWTQKANFPGTPRLGASAFAIGDTGYVGLGLARGFLMIFGNMTQQQTLGYSQLALAGQSAIFHQHLQLIIKDTLRVDLTASDPLQICGSLNHQTARGHKKPV